MSLKERLRGVVAVLATAAVALSVAPTVALAAAQPLTNGTAEVGGLQSQDCVVSLYKVASVSNDEHNVLQYETEDGFNFEVNDYLAASEDERATIANDVAAQLSDKSAAYVTPDDGTIVADGSAFKATFTDVEPGLYFVQVQPEEPGLVYQSMLLPVVPQASEQTGQWGVPSGSVELKANEDVVESTLTKQVSADGERWVGSVNTLDEGDTAYFKVTVQLPTYNGITAADDIDFKLYDQLPKGLTYVPNSAEASLGNASVNDDEIVVTLNAADLAENGGKTLTLTLRATVDAGQKGELTNSAWVVWYKHVTDKDAVSTEKKTASVVVYGANVTKVVGSKQGDTVVGTSNSTRLPGATFKLEKMNDEGGWVVIADEVATSTGDSNATTPDQLSLGAGTYRWTEVQAPAGYQLNTTPLVFTISDENVSNYISSQFFGDLKDESSLSNLPSTGESGTIALTVAGAGLVIAAATAVARTRKEH